MKWFIEIVGVLFVIKYMFKDNGDNYYYVFCFFEIYVCNFV